jgi:prepilin-type N-terminal cleavage/methylation domain-containing protein
MRAQQEAFTNNQPSPEFLNSFHSLRNSTLSQWEREKNFARQRANSFSGEGKKGFTLAEVLITIGIIGVVAALTIPALVASYQERVFITAYKKAYTDLTQAFTMAITEEELIPRSTQFDTTATESEWSAMKKKFRVQKECALNDLYSCWEDADQVCTGVCGMGAPHIAFSLSFIDVSGRSWAQYSYNENIYLVDTNGFKSPNKFGQDRWMFTLVRGGIRIDNGLPEQVKPLVEDQLTSNYWCHHAPCYYHSWLYEK